MNIVIRPETETDHSAIYAVTKLAFAGMPYAGGNEPEIVDLLRREGVLTISLVAQLDDQIVGHIAFSPAISGNGPDRWFALGPLSVHPAVQRMGIGSRLVMTGLNALYEAGAAGCVLVGSPAYYMRFGFVNVPQLAPKGEPDEYYFVKLIRGKMPSEPVGFHAAFYTEG